MKPPGKTKVKIQRPPILTVRTQDLVTRLQDKLKLPVLVYWVSTGGSICQNDVIAMSKLLGPATRQPRVALFLKSDGGNPEAALRFVHLLRQKFDHLTLLAPFECASAATMVALGANEIQMGPTSYLTAVDSSLKHDLSPVDHHNYLVSVSQDEVMRILRLWKERKCGDNPFPEVYKYLHPLVLGALDRSSSLSMRICQELLSYHVSNRAKVLRISRALNYDYPSHSYPITAREARKLGFERSRPGPGGGCVAARSQSRLFGNGPCPEHRLRHAELSQRRNLQYSRTRRAPGVLSGGKDWHYRTEEKRWIPLNDQSSWYLCVGRHGRWVPEKFFIR